MNTRFWLVGTGQRIMVPGEAAKVRRGQDVSRFRKYSHESLAQVQAVALLVALIFVAASCGSSEDTATSPTSTQTTVVGVGETSSDPGPTTSELATTSLAPARLDGIQVSDPTSDQITQWMEAMLPLQLTQVAPEIAPATCDDGGWISGVTVLPTAISEGEFNISCTVSSAMPLFVNLTDGTICIPGLGETLEELTDLCSTEPMFFVGDAPVYEAVLTVNGEQLPTPAVAITGIEWTDDSGAETVTYPVVYAGFSALLELPAGQYTIITGYRSLEDDSYLSTITVELTVEN